MRNTSSLIRYGILLLLLSCCWVALDQLSSGSHLSALLYLPAVLGFACLMVLGLRYLPLYLIGPLLSGLLRDQPIASTIVPALVLALCHAAAVYLLLQRLKIIPGLSRFRDVAWLIVLAGI